MTVRILACARTLFLEQGFSATSVQQIAALAGATKRTLYVKIGDKDALFHAVLVDLLREWRSMVAASPAQGSLRTRLEQLGEQLLTVMLSPDVVKLHRIAFSEAFRSPTLLQMLTEQIEGGPLPQLAALFMDVRNGMGRPTLEDEVAARLFYDMISSAPLRVALTGRRPLVDITNAGWVRQAVDVFLNGWQGTSS